MNLRALRLFRLVVTTGALAEASDRLNISVSAASRLLSQLERDVGLTLFSRQRRRLELTEHGQIFYRQIANTLIGIDEIPKVAKDIQGRTKEWLSIVTAAPLANGLAVPALTRLYARQPLIQCTINVESRFDIESKVSVRGYNLGLISLPVENAIIDLQVVPILRSRLCVLLPASHRLSQRKQIGIEELKNETFVTLTPGQRWRDRLEETMGRAGFSYNIVCETSSTVVNVDMVRAGLGITLIDRVCAPATIDKGLVLLPVTEPSWITYASLHPPGPHAPLAERFLDDVSSHIEDLRQSEPQTRDLLELI
ncbi:LysR family transcriptional regulator [Loktanella sp. DJP18]|uniref:LysR family transcriptional regulator n=1 Tax=Loktanella sp. DJP18 TaxID=3409788 RepID=UPI003BB7DB4A